MSAARPSWTAQGAAAQRAVLDRRGVLDDPFARTMLTPGLRAVADAAARAPRALFARGVTLAGAAASTRWFDERIGAALDGGIEQVAILGAGFDSRAWRSERPGVRFFELDHAASQAAKRAVAPTAPGPTWVTADLRSDPVLDALVAAGLDALRPTVVVLESVSMYLTEDAVRARLGELAGLAPGSVLLINVLPSTAPDTAATRRQLRMQQLLRRGKGERFTFRADPDDAADLIRDAGWRVEVVVSFRDAARVLLPPGSGLPVEQIDERKSLIAASLPGEDGVRG